MTAARAIVGIAAGVLATAAVLVAPAFGAADRGHAVKRLAIAAPAKRAASGFTPAAADPRLAAVFARGGLDSDAFRFTPADVRRNGRSVTVAVRARSNRNALASLDGRTGPAGASTIGIAPIAYNLGASVGWKHFAVSGNATRVDLGPVPGSREAADLALTYTAGRASSRLTAAADRPLAGSPKLVEQAPSYSVDLSSSYALTRNLDVTAGLRYRSDRERLARLEDDRRDSQAVYLGTAFRF